MTQNFVTLNKIISFFQGLEIEFEISDSCVGVVDRLEHVIAKISLDFERRGDLRITLTSPSGTKSNILDERPFDYSTRGFDNFDFLTVHMWDETPIIKDKKWKIKFQNIKKSNKKG